MFKNSVAQTAVQYQSVEETIAHSASQYSAEWGGECETTLQQVEFCTAKCNRYHKSSERPVVRIQQQGGHGANLCSTIPTIGTVNQDADPLLRNSLHMHATSKRRKESWFFLKNAWAVLNLNKPKSCIKH